MRTLLIAAGVLFLSSPVWAEQEATIGATLDNYYQAQDLALKRKDAKRLRALYHQFNTPDFKVVWTDGTIHTLTKEDRFWMIRSVRRVKTTIDKLTIQGDKAICVNTTDAVVNPIHELVVYKKLPAVIHSIARGKDIWVKTPQGWKMRERRLQE